MSNLFFTSNYFRYTVLSINITRGSVAESWIEIFYYKEKSYKGFKFYAILTRILMEFRRNSSLF